MSPTKKRYNTRFSVRNDEIVATSDISASLFGDIPKVRSLSKRIANSKQKSGVLADATNAKSIYTTSLRPRVFCYFIIQCFIFIYFQAHFDCLFFRLSLLHLLQLPSTARSDNFHLNVTLAKIILHPQLQQSLPHIHLR